MEWTPERVERLKQLWAKGLPARQIAQELGGVTRNAVIGKAHRIGLSSRPSPIKRGTPAVAATLVESESVCQWPIGHPGQKDFHFCNAPVEAGRPYCPEHCHMAYRRSSSEYAA